jgi:hypothetical protein
MKFWKFSESYAEEKAIRGFAPDRARVRSSLPPRSSLFAEWLSKQPAHKRLEILAAERAYTDATGPRLATMDEVAYQQMCGLEDTPAGGHPVLFNGTGDWSWQPQRYSDDPAKTKTYVPPRHPIYDGPTTGSPRAEEFQAKARAAHRAAGDYNRHAVQSGSVY